MMDEKKKNQNRQTTVDFLFGLDDQVPSGKTVVYGLQYLVYYIATGAIVPVIVGSYLGLDQMEIAAMLQRSFFLSGAISILQLLLGHRLPIMDGPSGLWTGLLIILISTSVSLGKDLSVLRTDIELGMIIAGLMALVVGLSGLILKLFKLFTPIVNGTFLILMALQMSGTVMEGATGLSSGYATIQGRYLIVFLVTLAVIIFINLQASGFIQSIATLIGVAVGWVLAIVLQVSPGMASSEQSLIALPKAFAWGTPTVDWSVILTCVIGEFVLFSNLAASINGMSDLLEQPITEKEVKHGTALFGMTAALCGIFPVVGFVPFTSAPSMIKITRVAARAPYILGGIFAMIMGLITPVCMLLSAIPRAVGYAAFLVMIAMMMEQGLREYRKIEFTVREGLIAGVSFMVGAGVMFLDATAFVNLPQMLQYVVSNGLIVGLLVAILMEHVLLRKRE